MGIINVLDKHTAELIAAGEVVERPASIIKELLENSIDAKATAITVEIKNGGVKYIRITDNGNGFFKDDVPKAFLRHATSKVREKDDLDAIATLGFRGEALASISAVAKVEVLTCTKEETIGTRYVIEGGVEQLNDDAGCPKGTTLVVRDVFYNVPARMKFLKRDVSEANAVANVVDKLALSHPEVAITFIRDGKQTLKTTGDAKLLSAIYSVYGREFANGMQEVNYSLNGVDVFGYISKPQYARPNRSMQNFFLNGRFVKSGTAMAGLAEASKGSVMVSKHLACVLHINVEKNCVDVNVHPAKIEVRFVNEKPIFEAIYHGVKTSLTEKDEIKEAKLNIWDNVRPKNHNVFSLEKTPYDAKPKQYEDVTISQIQRENKNSQTAKTDINSSQNTTTDVAKSLLNKYNEYINNDEPIVTIPRKTDYKNVCVADSAKVYREYKNNVYANEEKTDNNIKINRVDIAKEFFTNSNNTPAETKENNANDELKELLEYRKTLNENANNNSNQNSSSTINEPEPKEDEFLKDSAKTLEDEFSSKYVGEAFNTYIIIEKNENELLLIDKHAAHERIIYEKLKKEKGQAFAQMLLVPIAVTLTKNEYDAVINNKEVMYNAGFEVDDFGNGTVLVRSSPQYLENVDIEHTVMEIAGYLLENKNDINTENMDWVYHSVACRSAIKAGNINKPQELIQIALKLQQDKELRYCPHGRPISIIIPKRELEKQFGRIQ